MLNRAFIERARHTWRAGIPVVSVDTTDRIQVEALLSATAAVLAPPAAVKEKIDALDPEVSVHVNAAIAAAPNTPIGQLYLDLVEENQNLRAIEILSEVFRSILPVVTWNMATGFSCEEVASCEIGVRNALMRLSNTDDRTLPLQGLFVLYGTQHHLTADDPAFREALLYAAGGGRLMRSYKYATETINVRRQIWLVQSNLVIPPELKGLITKVDLPPLSIADAKVFMSQFVKTLPADRVSDDPVVLNDMSMSLRGMGPAEADRAVRLAVSEASGVNQQTVRIVRRLQADAIRAAVPGLSIYPPEEIEDVQVIGFDEVKDIVKQLQEAESPARKTATLSRPRGIFMIGYPGVGKTIIPKEAAKNLNKTLVCLSLGELKNSLVGESESNMRKAINVMRAFGNTCIVFLDEINKMFGSRHTTDPTTPTMMQMMLEYLSEPDNGDRPFFFAAANGEVDDVALTRSGRFSKTVAIDLPDTNAKMQIANYAAKKLNVCVDISFGTVEQSTYMFSGADIFQAVTDAEWIAYKSGSIKDGKCVINEKAFKQACAGIRTVAMRSPKESAAIAEIVARYTPRPTTSRTGSDVKF